jgi:hypothetical protein
MNGYVLLVKKPNECISLVKILYISMHQPERRGCRMANVREFESFESRLCTIKGGKTRQHKYTQVHKSTLNSNSLPSFTGTAKLPYTPVSFLPSAKMKMKMKMKPSVFTAPETVSKVIIRSERIQPCHLDKTQDFP